MYPAWVIKVPITLLVVAVETTGSQRVRGFSVSWLWQALSRPSWGRRKRAPNKYLPPPQRGLLPKGSSQISCQTLRGAARAPSASKTPSKDADEHSHDARLPKTTKSMGIEVDDQKAEALSRQPAKETKNALQANFWILSLPYGLIFGFILGLSIHHTSIF